MKHELMPLFLDRFWSSTSEAFKNIDSIRISKDNTKKFINGVKFKHQKTQIDYIKVYGEDNKFLGLGEVNKNYLKHKQLV